MNYQTLLKRHPSEYKRKELGIAVPGVYRYRGRDIPCDHILPIEQRWQNLLPAALGPTQAYLQANPTLKLHRYFHHLNSSQAFAFNLFFPFFEAGKDANTALLRALAQSAELANWKPEAVPDAREESNIDVTWLTADGRRTFCEIKLSEAELGRAVDDDYHRQKFRDIYFPSLEEHLDSALLTPAAFFEIYQFGRNVWHLVRTPNSHLIFLLPRENTAVWNALQDLIPQVSLPTRRRIAVSAIEDVLTSLAADPRCRASLRDHARSLMRKYIPARTY